MNTTIKLSAILVLCITFLCVNDTKAQMAAARKISPDLIKELPLNSSAKTVWAFISQPQNYGSFVSNTTNFSCSGNGVGAKMVFSLPADNKRTQEVSIINEKDKLVAYYITKSEYYSQPWVIRMVVDSKQQKALVRYEVIYGISDKTKNAEMKAKVEKEWELVKQGLQQKFN